MTKPSGDCSANDEPQSRCPAYPRALRRYVWADISTAEVEIRPMKPYAVYLLERFLAGETAEELALKEGIPVKRIRTRLAAAATFLRTRPIDSDIKRAA